MEERCRDKNADAAARHENARTNPKINATVGWDDRCNIRSVQPRKADLVVYLLRDGNNRACTAIMDVPAVCMAHVAAILHSETGQNVASRTAEMRRDNNDFAKADTVSNRKYLKIDSTKQSTKTHLRE